MLEQSDKNTYLWHCMKTSCQTPVTMLVFNFVVSEWSKLFFKSVLPFWATVQVASLSLWENFKFWPLTLSIFYFQSMRAKDKLQFLDAFTVQISCGSVTSFNCTYFTNPGFPGVYTSTEQCKITVYRCNSNICQVGNQRKLVFKNSICKFLYLE